MNYIQCTLIKKIIKKSTDVQKTFQQIVKTMLLSSGERGDITWTLCQTTPVPPHSPHHLHSLSHCPSEKTKS